MQKNGWNILKEMVYCGSIKQVDFPLAIQTVVVYVWFLHRSIGNNINFSNLDEVIERANKFVEGRYMYFISIMIN